MTIVNTHEDYLTEPQTLIFEQMTEIHQQIISEIGIAQEALEYYANLLKVSAKYASIRALWPAVKREEKMEQDARRASAHNSVIIYVNMLSRLL